MPVQAPALHSGLGQELSAARRYHSPVRRILFLLMVVLLPLRGWVGDAMALQTVLAGGMAHAAQADTASAAAHGQQGHHGLAIDHPRHASAVAPPNGDCADPSDGDSGLPHGHCTTCTACQTCHTVAITAPSAGMVGGGPMTALPSLVEPRFASADRAPGFKPPIS